MVFSAQLSDIAEVIAASPASGLNLHQCAAAIATDTRQLHPGSLFVALRGERFDGHAFVPQAIAAGAIAAIVAPDYDAGELPVLTVADPLAAYQAIAHWWRRQFQIPVIAVTGSVGKTTTKELIAAVLGTAGTVLKSPANHNNEIGLPKTLLQLAPHHDFAVVEMGMRGAGEIALLSQLAQPDVAVITNVGTAHIGRLGSEQAIAAAKCELLADLPSTSIAVLNYDNARLMTTAAQVWAGRTLTFGLTGGDVRGTVTADGTAIALETANPPASQVVPLPLPGAHNAVNFLAAVAVAQAVGLKSPLSLDNVTVALPSGRSRRLTLPQDIVLLDETYNAGVESMTAALHLLAATPGDRHIAVLGTMKELGEYTAVLHEQVGTVAQHLGLDQVFTLAEPEAEAALRRGVEPVPMQAYQNAPELAQQLIGWLRPGDRVLFKASRSVQLDQVVDQVMAALQPAPTAP